MSVSTPVFCGVLFLCTCAQAGISACLALFFGLIVAHALLCTRGWYVRYARSLLPVLSIVPTKLLIFTMSIWAPRGFMGIILAHLCINIPFAAYSMLSAYETIDEQVVLTARNLGANKVQTYITIILPLLKPTLLYMARVIFFICFSSHSIPPLLATYWYHYTPDAWMLEHGQEIGSGYSIFFRMAILGGSLFFLPTNTSKNISQGVLQNSRAQISHMRNVLLEILGLGLLLCCFVPVCLFSVHAYRHSTYMHVRVGAEYIDGISIMQVIKNSILLAALSGLGSVLCAFFSVRYIKFFCSYTGIVCGVIGGITLWIRSGQLPAFTCFWWSVLYHIFLNYRLAANCLCNHIALYSREWSLTAQSYGATGMQVIRTIMVPFARRAIIKAWCIGFGLSLTEVGVSSLSTSDSFITLAVAIRMFRAANYMPGIIVYSLVILIIVFSMSCVIERCE